MSRKIDALVAEKVMGWNLASNAEGQPVWCTRKVFDDGTYINLAAYLDSKWCPSSGIAAAWEVVDAVLKWRDDVRFSIYFGCICKPTARFFVVASGADLALCFADTAPLAICLAALRAVGVDEELIVEAMNA